MKHETRALGNCRASPSGLAFQFDLHSNTGYNDGAMNTTATIEYAVRLSGRATNGTKHWRAFVETLPQIQAEGENCEGVLEEIGRQLHAVLAIPENETAPSNASGLSADELAKLEAQVQAQGHKLYGIFADDPGALDVFDEIERLRNEETVSPATICCPPSKFKIG